MITFPKGYSVSAPCLPLEGRGYIAIFVSPLACFCSGTYESGLDLYVNSTTRFVKGLP